MESTELSVDELKSEVEELLSKLPVRRVKSRKGPAPRKTVLPPDYTSKQLHDILRQVRELRMESEHSMNEQDPDNALGLENDAETDVRQCVEGQEHGEVHESGNDDDMDEDEDSNREFSYDPPEPLFLEDNEGFMTLVLRARDVDMLLQKIYDEEENAKDYQARLDKKRGRIHELQAEVHTLRAKMFNIKDCVNELVRNGFTLPEALLRDVGLPV